MARDLSCYWQITDDNRKGACVYAGYFKLCDAVREALSLLESSPKGASVTVEPWFQSREDEFRFWASYWSNNQ